METVVAQYDIAELVWFLDTESNKILSGVVDKIYITVYRSETQTLATTISYLVEVANDMVYTSTEAYMSDDPNMLAAIIESNLDIGGC